MITTVPVHVPAAGLYPGDRIDDYVVKDVYPATEVGGARGQMVVTLARPDLPHQTVDGWEVASSAMYRALRPHMVDHATTTWPLNDANGQFVPAGTTAKIISRGPIHLFLETEDGRKFKASTRQIRIHNTTEN